MNSTLKRLVWLPYGLFLGLFELANNKARDLQNKRRFSKSKIDSNSSFCPKTSIAKNSHILSNTIINNSQVGSYSYVGRNCLIQNTTIGNYCSIANNVMIGLGKHPTNLLSTSPIFYKKKNTFNKQIIKEDIKFKEYEDIKIGNDVWVGAGVIILDGVNIGNGAIIAAGAVVTKDVKDYSIIAGIPAKLIRSRFSPETCKKLSDTRWWLNNPEYVTKIENDFLAGQIEGLSIK